MIKVQIGAADDTGRHPWWWRKRVGMTPLYFGILAALLSAGSLLLSLGQVLIVLVTLSAISGWGAQQKWGKKKDAPMRTFMWIVIGATDLFVLLVRNGVIQYGWILVSALVGICGLGWFWWTDQWNQKRVKIERDVERWPELAKKLSMSQVRRSPVKSTDTGRRWHFWWGEGEFTLGNFKSKARELESALGIPDNHIRFEHVYPSPGMKDPNHIIVTENTESPILKEPVKFGRPTMQYFTDPMFIAPREDNSRHEVTWYQLDFGGMHTLAAGATGSGKSGLYHLVLAESCFCPDVVRWGIDAKGGMALRPWASIFDWMITDVDESYHMLIAVHAILKERSKYAAEQGWDVWQPSAEHPVLLFVVDEAAEVFGLEQFDLNALAASIARMGRAAGVIFLLATQHPTNEALASTQLTKNIRRRFCFSVEDESAQRAIIPKSSGRFDASDIPIGPQYVGTYYSSEGGNICELSARVRHVTPHDIYQLVLEIGAEGSPVAVTDLDELSALAATRATTDPETEVSVYAERRIWTVLDAIPPKGWVGPNADDIAGARVEQVQPPAPSTGAPAPPAEPFVTGAPVPVAALGAPPGPGPAEQEDPVIPWTDNDPPMGLDTITTPRTAEEAQTLAAAVAAYVKQFATEDMSPAEAERMLDELLDKAPAEGIAIRHMREVIPRSQSWFSDKLRARLVAQPAQVAKVGNRYLRPARKLASVGAGDHPE